MVFGASGQLVDEVEFYQRHPENQKANGDFIKNLLIPRTPESYLCKHTQERLVRALASCLSALL